METMKKHYLSCEQDEKLMTAFIQTLYIQMEVTEAAMRRCNFKSHNAFCDITLFIGWEHENIYCEIDHHVSTNEAESRRK